MLNGAERRQAVVILGMHRSGTSALAGTAARLGLAAPRTPLPGSSDNPSGFYESLPVVMIDHQLLVAAGCAWNLCLSFQRDWLDRHVDASVRELMLGTLHSEFPGGADFVLKDPRICLTFPAWLPVLQAMPATARVLIVLRHPAEVIRSLAVRNQFPAGSTAPHWLHHMLEAEHASRGLPRAVVTYDDLMQDWRGCMIRAAQVAGIRWPRPIESACGEIDGFLAAPKRHHHTRREAALVDCSAVDGLINDAWATLQHLATDPEDGSALARLDHIRGQFASWRRAAVPPGFRVVLPQH